MYSVMFNRKNGRKYYQQSSSKYHLDAEDIMLEEIPVSSSPEKMPFYYYENGKWKFDTDAYEKSQWKTVESIAPQTITNEDIAGALVELALDVSDLEDAIIELARREG